MPRLIQLCYLLRRLAATDASRMARCPTAFVLVLVLVLAGCADRDEDIKPVIPPLPSVTVRQAEAGNAAAQFILADHYRALEQAEPMFSWLRESARHGYPLAQTSLGVLYLNGDGVPLNRVEAYSWFVLAADQGESDAIKAENMLRIELTDDELKQALELVAKRSHPLPP
jgi:hypothetical protein